MKQTETLERLIKIRDKVEAAYGVDAADLWNVIQDLIEDVGLDVRSEYLELQGCIRDQALSVPMTSPKSVPKTEDEEEEQA